MPMFEMSDGSVVERSCSDCEEDAFVCEVERVCSLGGY